jgi:hypothetical protein
LHQAGRQERIALVNVVSSKGTPMSATADSPATPEAGTDGHAASPLQHPLASKAEANMPNNSGLDAEGIARIAAAVAALKEPGKSAPDAPALTPYQRKDLFVKWLALAVQMCGFAAVGAGLYLSARATKNNTVAIISSWSYDLDKQFLQKPYLRPYFDDGVDIDAKNPHYPEAVSMAEMHADVMDSMLSTQGFPPHQGWEIWMKRTFQRSPIFRRWVEEHREYYEALWTKWERWRDE